MIRKSKNKYYEITVEFFQNREIKTLKFISDYSISTKKFKAFADAYFARLEGFEMYTEDWASQFTVSNRHYEEYKDKLHEGMEPDRYCLVENVRESDKKSWEQEAKVYKAFKWLIDRLREEGCGLQVYEAKSTSSCYIKIDNGVAGSIRISDHKGKSHLTYKYNLILGGERKTVGVMGTHQHFFRFQDIEDMLRRIIKDRNEIASKYQASAYLGFMSKNAENSKSNKFWKNATQASKIDLTKGVFRDGDKNNWKIGKS